MSSNIHYYHLRFRASDLGASGPSSSRAGPAILVITLVHVLP